MYIIIGGDQKEYGPITADEVREWIAEGRLNEASSIKVEGEAEFRPLGKIPEFAFSFGGTRAIPPTIQSTGPAGIDDGRESALKRVKGPAVALIVVAILNLLLEAYGLFSKLFFQPNQGELDSQLRQLNNPQLMEFTHKWMHMANGPLGIVGALLGLALSLLILLGAIKMLSLRSYQFSMTAAIVAMLPCVTSCCLLGLPFGIWALVVLTRPEVKSHFR